MSAPGAPRTQTYTSQHGIFVGRALSLLSNKTTTKIKQIHAMKAGFPGKRIAKVESLCNAESKQNTDLISGVIREDHSERRHAPPAGSTTASQPTFRPLPTGFPVPYPPSRFELLCPKHLAPVLPLVRPAKPGRRRAKGRTRWSRRVCYPL